MTRKIISESHKRYGAFLALISYAKHLHKWGSSRGSFEELDRLEPAVDAAKARYVSYVQKLPLRVRRRVAVVEMLLFALPGSELDLAVKDMIENAWEPERWVSDYEAALHSWGGHDVLESFGEHGLTYQGSDGLIYLVEGDE